MASSATIADFQSKSEPVIVFVWAMIIECLALQLDQLLVRHMLIRGLPIPRIVCLQLELL